MTDKTKSNLHTLLTEYASPEELRRTLDRILLSLVLLMKYEPESLEILIDCYQLLYDIRQAIFEELR